MRKSDRPVLVLILATVQMAIGILLLCCCGFGLISAVAGGSSATVTITSGGKTTTRVYDTHEEMAREAASYKAFTLGSGVAGIVLAAMMVIGGIGLLRSKAWGWWLSLAWGVLELAYLVATAAYLWLVAMPACNRVVQTVPHDDAGVCGPLANGNTLYHLVWALFSTGFVFYPTLVLILLALPPVRRACAPRDFGDEEWDDRRRRRRRGERDDWHRPDHDED
ncbi:MAG TPA: hypothetical protein VKE74_23395 [Gemmataceae bacterium]|nr:hypothetical protein [Gemmataceae bacterium]